jgi:Cu/Ag efflux pump CusA
VADLGFRPVEALEAIQTAYQGEIATQTYRANQITDVAVLLDDTARNDPDQVGSFLLRNSLGTLWPLRELADIQRGNTRYTILHEGARRRQTVTCNPEGSIADFVKKARREIAAKVNLPRGCYVEYGGSSEQEEIATREILTNSAIAAVGIVLLLSIVLGNARNLVLVLINLPFALAGGILAIHAASFFTRDSIGLSMGAMVGFVTLFGITTRNSIMLISHYDHLVRFEAATWNFETMLRGASERLVPILMTALVTALGLLPLALGSGEPGKEIEGPMAIVILGGLFSSTTLNLLVLPPLALRYGKFLPRTATI